MKSYDRKSNFENPQTIVNSKAFPRKRGYIPREKTFRNTPLISKTPKEIEMNKVISLSILSLIILACMTGCCTTQKENFDKELVEKNKRIHELERNLDDAKIIRVENQRSFIFNGNTRHQMFSMGLIIDADNFIITRLQFEIKTPKHSNIIFRELDPKTFTGVAIQVNEDYYKLYKYRNGTWGAFKNGNPHTLANN